jgi:hypothetical protein
VVESAPCVPQRKRQRRAGRPHLCADKGTDTDRKQISDLISGQDNIDLNTGESTKQRSRGSRIKVGDKVLL